MSELWRRGVVRPHTPDVAQEIWAATVHESSPVDYLPIDDRLFSCLLDSRLFDDLNEACGTMVGDYEEDQLVGDALTIGIEIIDRHAATPKYPMETQDFLRRLAVMAHTARDTKTPLIFVL